MRDKSMMPGSIGFSLRKSHLCPSHARKLRLFRKRLTDCRMHMMQIVISLMSWSKKTKYSEGIGSGDLGLEGRIERGLGDPFIGEPDDDSRN
jgi:hypothetical protein